MSLDQRQLKAFLAVVDAGSLGRATERVGMSQPALSRIISEIEARLGCKLFDRHSKGMSVTSFGEALVPHARLLVFEMHQAIDAIDAVRGIRRGVVRIGAVATLARTILPEAVGQLLQKFPGVSVELEEAPDDRLTAALLRREIDVMLAGAIPFSEEIHISAECRFNDNYTVLCSADHALTRSTAATVRDLMRCEWVMPPRGAKPRELFEQMVLDLGIGSPNVTVETWSPSAMVAFVARTALLGWLPTPLVAAEVAAGNIVTLNLKEFQLPRRFFVYRRGHGILSPVAAQLIREIPRV